MDRNDCIIISSLIISACFLELHVGVFLRRIDLSSLWGWAREVIINFSQPVVSHVWDYNPLCVN